MIIFSFLLSGYCDGKRGGKVGGMEEIENAIKWLEYVRKQIFMLEQQLRKAKNDKDIQYLFDELNKLTGVQFDAVIYIDGNVVKYIPKQEQSNAKNVLIVSKNEGYHLREYKVGVSDDVHDVVISYNKSYNIPDYISEILKRLPDNDVSVLSYADANISKLYLLLKQGYHLFYSVS